MLCLLKYVGHAPLAIRTATMEWDGTGPHTYNQLMSDVLRVVPTKRQKKKNKLFSSETKEIPSNSSTDVDLPCH